MANLIWSRFWLGWESGALSRRLLSSIAAIIILVPVLAACTTKLDPEAANDLRLYQVLPVARSHSKLVEGEGEGEAIAIINAGKKPHAVDQWRVATNQGTVVLPKLTLDPGKVVYLADNAEYFKDYWNFAPDFEYGRDADNAVPDLRAPDSKQPVMNDQGDVVRLLDDTGKPVDIFVFGNISSGPAPWSGPAAQFVTSFPITPANQVFTRVRKGDLLAMEPKADSWSGGTPQNPQRVWFAGQSDFPVASAAGPMTLVAASAPDNAGPMLFDLVDKAKKSIRIVGYQYTNVELGQHLIDAAKRGVKVQVGIERNPGGGDMFETDKEAQEVLARGGVEILYYYKWDGDLSTRFNPVHSKYAIFDEESVLVSSGNWTNSVYNNNATCGNREWVMVVKNNPDVVKLVKEVWEFDFAAGAPEVRRWDEKLDRPLLPDDYDPGPCFPYAPVKREPLTLQNVQAKITRILSPDNTMDREQGFLGLIRNAKQELLISANYINLWWGAAGDPKNLTNYPDPYITEIVAAARRGVDVKVIFDRKSVKVDNLRDNQYTVKYLNDLAAKDGLQLEARLINMDGAGIGRTYHNKSLVVDGSVIISSINGSENSFRYARELAFKVDGAPEFTGYFRDLFMHDWEASKAPNQPWNLLAQPREDGTFIDWSKNAELDVVKYEVYYKSDPAGDWTRLGEVTRPGFEDFRTTGTWGVAAVNQAGQKSSYAEISR